MPSSIPRAPDTPLPAAGLIFAWGVALMMMAALWLMPGSGIALGTLTDWHDQSVFLRAAVQTIELGLPNEATRSLVGPAYVGFTVALSQGFGLSPEMALILLSRVTFVACAGLLTLVAMRDRVRSGPIMQVVLVAVGLLPLMTSVWFRVLDVPWTHFVATAVLGAMVVVSLLRIPLALRAALVAALFVVLAQTRMFEALVALVAAALVAAVALLRHWHEVRSRPAATLVRGGLHLALPAAAGGLAGFVLAGLLSHNWSLYQQYGGQEGMVLSPSLAPIKAVQLFWDTCFATACEFAPVVTVPPFPDTLDAWRQPLLLQLPGLAAAAAGLLALLVLRPLRTMRLPLGLWFAVLTAGGIVLAYVSGAPSGSPHLKYGFFRDFIAPLILLTLAFVAALAMGRASDGRWSVRLLAPLAVFLVVIATLTALRPAGLPQVPGPQVSRFEIASSCGEGECSFTLTALDAEARPVPYDDLAYATCDGEPLPRVVQRVADLRIRVADCARVGIVPLASGVLYTPEGVGFLKPGLDLAQPNDTVSLPIAP